MYEFRLPALGSDMEDGTLLRWNIAVGQSVHRGDVVAVVDTAKAAIDIECWHDGIVDVLLVEPGTKVKVGTVLARLRRHEESESTHAEIFPEKSVAGAAQRISPVARRKAEQQGVDWRTLAGSGPDGAVTLADVERAAGPEAAVSTSSQRREAMRGTIAAAMSRSKREIPHYYLSDTVSFDTARHWLNQYNAEQPVTERVLPVALLIKAVALACLQYPEFNGHYRDGYFAAADAVHVGIAIALRDGGLIAPALLDVANLRLPMLMQALTDLVQRSRAGSLRSTELSAASITVTNLGEQGVESVLGVIYPPQVAMVGLGVIAMRPWLIDGQPKAAELIQISLAADHRVSDGHRGALFLRKIADSLQYPERL
ncbi:MAG: dihydrolipoamide acetyltransferase family protein [Pseudomonadota bacterium]